MHSTNTQQTHNKYTINNQQFGTNNLIQLK